MVWIRAHYLPVIKRSLGWLWELSTTECQVQRDRFRKTIPLSPALKSAALGPTFPLDELQKARQHQVQTRICSKLQRAGRRTRLHVPSYNHSATKSLVNTV